VPLQVTADVLEKVLSSVDPLITSVELIDFFEKEDWVDKRSLTFRVWINHPEKTLEKEEIDSVWQKAVTAVKKLGAVLRD
jgi:phenylalanyl-tRNA synthetase beta subunit